MSKLAKLLKKPRISRLITFGVVAVLIGVSAYFIYKRTVGADVPVACKVQLKEGVDIKFDATQNTGQTGGTVVNGWQHIYLALNSINDTQFLSNQNRWIQIYGQGGTVYLHAKGSLPIMNPPLPAQPEIKSSTFDCTGGKIWEVTYANTSRTGTQGITVNQIQSPGNTTDLVCVKEIATGRPLKMEHSLLANTEGTIYSIMDPGFCEEGPDDQGGTTITTDTRKCVKWSGDGLYYWVIKDTGGDFWFPESSTAPAMLRQTGINTSALNIQANTSLCTVNAGTSPSPSPSPSASPSPNTSPSPTIASDGCPSGQIKVNMTDGSGQSCYPCSDIPATSASTGQTGDYTFDVSNYRTKCSPVENGGNTTGGGGAGGPDSPNTTTNAAGVQWKCLKDGSAWVWFYKVTGGWRAKSGRYFADSVLGSFQESSTPTKDCGNVPTDTPAGATTSQGTTKPGCPTGQKCYQHASEAPICIKDEGPTAGGFPGSPYYTQVDSSKCSYTENTFTTTDTPLQSLPGSVSVPVGGLSAQEQAALKTGEVAITAYRYSQAGESMADGKYTQVGGVSFNLSGDVITKTDSGAQMPASTSTEKVFNNGFACSAWQKAKASLPSGIRSALFKNIASFKITTPDNGDGNSATQLLKLPVGVYSISGGTKTGLRLKDSFCFSVTEGQTKDLKVLLVASSGAEPPSISSDKISYEKTANGVNRYFANGYMYIPEYPYYGWQKIDQNASNNGYNTNQPPGLNSQGGIVPGINPGLGIPGGSMADLMRICQSANIQLGGSLDTDNLWQLGAGIGFLTGEGDIGDRLGSGFAGGAIGWLAGKLFGGKNLDFSINVNTINQQCQQLNQVSIPFDCTGCYSGGYCPPGCTAGNPGIQGLNLLSMLFGNNR